MKKLIWLVDMSLDGFMSRPRGELDWVSVSMDDELSEDVDDLLNMVDAALFGRVTYELFESYWTAVPGSPASPKHELDFSRWIGETPKIVGSRTLKKLTWKNSMLIPNDASEGVSRIKEQSGKNILMFGSCNLASGLLEAGLIDELWLRVHPVILGMGVPLFKNQAGQHRLKLTHAKTFRSGVIRARYSV